jgi:hypothetical protein
MFAGSPQCRVRQRIVEDRAALQAKTMDRTVIAERNVVRSDIMVPPLDSIHNIIQTYHWGYLHTSACIVYTRLVKLFYANLEVVQDDDCGLVLQSTIAGNIITIDPQVISHFIRVPVLEIPGNSYNEVVLFPLWMISGSFSMLFHKLRSAPPPSGYVLYPPHTACWPRSFNKTYVARRSDLILKRAQFVYVVHLRLPFCQCKHILGVMLEARDEGNTELAFGCLLTHIIF